MKLSGGSWLDFFGYGCKEGRHLDELTFRGWFAFSIPKKHLFICANNISTDEDILSDSENYFKHHVFLALMRIN